jgi:hypothetical protein
MSVWAWTTVEAAINATATATTSVIGALGIHFFLLREVKLKAGLSHHLLGWGRPGLL